MHLSGMQIIIKTCPGSHGGYSGGRNTFFLFKPFVLFPVLDDGFSPSHVAEPEVGFVTVSSLVIQHHQCYMKRAERLSPSESSAQKSSKISAVLLQLGAKPSQKLLE